MDLQVFITVRMNFEGKGRRMVGGRSSSDPIQHDIHPALMHMTAPGFGDLTRRVLSGSSDLDDVIVASGVPDAYLVGSECSSYEAWIEKEQFVAYLERLGIGPREASSMTEAGMDAVRARAGFEIAPVHAPGF